MLSRHTQKFLTGRNFPLEVAFAVLVAGLCFGVLLGIEWYERLAPLFGVTR